MHKSIRYFLAVAKFGNIKRASEALHITQPTLTTAIKKLESELNAPLFNRQSKGVELTSFGIKYLDFAQKTQESYSELRYHFDDMQQRETGKIKFGCGELWWECFVKASFSQLYLESDGLSLHLELGNNLALMQHLIDGDIDFFIGHEILDLSPHCAVSFSPLFQDKEAMYVHNQHPLLNSPTSKQSLDDYPLVRVTPNHPRHQTVLASGLPNSTEHLNRCVIDVNSVYASFDLLNSTNGVLPYSDKAQPWFLTKGLVPIWINDNKLASVGIYTKLSESKASISKVIDFLAAEKQVWKKSKYFNH